MKERCTWDFSRSGCDADGVDRYMWSSCCDNRSRKERAVGSGHEEMTLDRKTRAALADILSFEGHAGLEDTLDLRGGVIGKVPSLSGC